MKPVKQALFWGTILMMAAGLALNAGVAAADGHEFPCVADDKLDKTIAAGAELAEMVCFFKRWEGVETLHFKVTVKNVSDADQRFRVNIFLDNDKAVGGLIPRKTKKGLVKPGDTASFTYPVKNTTEKPGEVVLLIKPLGK